MKLSEQTISQLRSQNAELLGQLATAQEFIAKFPSQISAARLDAKAGIDTKYDYKSHGEILRFAGGSEAIRTQQKEEMEDFKRVAAWITGE